MAIIYYDEKPGIQAIATPATLKARASQAANAGPMSKAEERTIDKKADAVLKKG